MPSTQKAETYTLVEGGNISGPCPGCNGERSRFLVRDGASELPAIVQEVARYPERRKLYRLLRCGGCGRGALAVMLGDRGGLQLIEFHPSWWTPLPLPKDAPAGVVAEFREAERCASVAAYRAASALTRSALEKTFKANGYVTGTLNAKIDAAAADGVITASRQSKAHSDVRVLGNEVVHDEWRAVDAEEASSSLHYTQRVLEDLYDDRPSVEKLLAEKRQAKKG